MHGTGSAPISSRLRSPLLLNAALLCLFVVLTLPAAAQDLQRQGGAYTLPPGSMPPWAVPVLRLVSSTHVEPTTGIVISDDGMVLVPEDFASMGDEIIVLDGGTDIIRNGRPARIERKFTAQGLQVLFVQGLSRKGVTLAAGTPENGDEIVLEAFPPAEQITEGKPPLNVTASVVVFEQSGNAAISGETRLPNVTGGLVDRCGNLVAISLADDVQSMEPSAATRYQWKQTLTYILGELNIPLRERPCGESVATAEPEPQTEEPVAEEPAVEEPPAEEPVPEEDQPAEPEVVEEEIIEELPADILPPVESGDDGAEMPVEEETSGNWPWLLAALALFVIGFVLHRLRRRKNAVEASSSPESPSAVPVQPDPAEEPGSAGAALDSLLRIRGQLADGTEFEASCPVSERAVNVTVGRGDVDLKIDSRVVSRAHANLNGTRRELTVTDLGSSNGTSVNGVPCLEGEILFIEPGDVLILGDARCTVEIVPANRSGGDAP